MIERRIIMGQELLNQLSGTVINAVGALLCALISYGVVVGIAYLKKLQTKALIEIEKIDDEASRDFTKSILDDVTSALTTAAKSIEESMVPALKSATEDGKLNKDDQVLVFNSAKQLADKLMGETTKQLLTGVVDNTEVYINAKLQEILNDMKASGNNITSTKSIENLNS
jgi:uncharacterized protein YaaR (DUF327 family)